ncbi:hypothetical protein L6255_01225, partial [Candidatus Parcubacteria bacterium]|nr:hypothetical protein [Candidatus Parcubacteria bacterium]
DGQVDIVGFSLGGQIIREYLAQMVRSMETEEDDRPHHIANAIIIASPNKGSSYLEIKKSLGDIPNSIISIVGDAVLYATNDNNQPIAVNSTAMEQIRANSSFMKRVESRYATDLNYYTLYGDINVTQKMDLFGVSLGGKLSVGDGLVEADSGKNIPGITPNKQIPFGDQLTVEAKIKIKDTYADVEISQPNVLTADRFIHKVFIEQPEVSQKVLEILQGV